MRDFWWIPYDCAHYETRTKRKHPPKINYLWSNKGLWQTTRKWQSCCESQPKCSYSKICGPCWSCTISLAYFLATKTYLKASVFLLYLKVFTTCSSISEPLPWLTYLITSWSYSLPIIKMNHSWNWCIRKVLWTLRQILLLC